MAKPLPAYQARGSYISRGGCLGADGESNKLTSRELLKSHKAQRSRVIGSTGVGHAACNACSQWLERRPYRAVGRSQRHRDAGGDSGNGLDTSFRA